MIAMGRRLDPSKDFIMKIRARAWAAAVDLSRKILEGCWKVVPLEVSVFTISVSGTLARSMVLKSRTGSAGSFSKDSKWVWPPHTALRIRR